VSLDLPPRQQHWPEPDAMPSTRGVNFYIADPNLEFVCSTVMDRDVFERARPLLVELGAVAGDELDALAAQADRNPPTLRPYDERGRRVDEIVFHRITRWSGSRSSASASPPCRTRPACSAGRARCRTS
jgi:hypothetical protein